MTMDALPLCACIGPGRAEGTPPARAFSCAATAATLARRITSAASSSPMVSSRAAAWAGMGIRLRGMHGPSSWWAQCYISVDSYVLHRSLHECRAGRPLRPALLCTLTTFPY